MSGLQRVENGLVEFAATVGPWLAPIPTAYLVGRALMLHLEYPVIVAVVGGLVIELLGLSSTNVALTFYEYNRERRKSDQAAPVWLAITLVLAYFLTATLLTVALDVFPDLVIYAPIIFPTLSLTGVGVLALRADHRRRLQAIEDVKEERKKQRQMSRKVNVEKSQNQRLNTRISGASVDEMNAARKLKQKERIDIVRQRKVALSDDFSVTELANELGVSRQTIYNDLDVISNNGRN